MFKRARLKLTTWYLLIIMAVSLIFSVAIYRVLVSEVERFEQAQRFRIERGLRGENFLPNNKEMHSLITLPPNPELVEETKQRILFSLLIVNSMILVAAGGLGYFLAGRTLKPIKEMVDEQNQFISDASHELRTPLTSLKSAFEVYLRDKNPSLKETKKIMNESINEVNKLQSLSENMLQLTQYQTQNNNLIFEQISLLNIIQEAIRKVEPMAKKKNIKFVKKLKKIETEGNKYSLSDLMVILLDNAIKYSTDDSRIEIRTQKTNDSILLSVKDYGIGISEKDLPHIFNRFYRADSARSKLDSGGYGLGLSIATKIVQAHKGSITVESELEKGSNFIVCLPLKQIECLK